MKNNKQYTIKQVAGMIPISDVAVRKYIRDGKLEATMENRYKGYRISHEALCKFANNYPLESGNIKFIIGIDEVDNCSEEVETKVEQPVEAEPEVIEPEVQEPTTEVEVQEPVTEIDVEAEQDNETVEPSDGEPTEVVEEVSEESEVETEDMEVVDDSSNESEIENTGDEYPVNIENVNVTIENAEVHVNVENTEVEVESEDMEPEVHEPVTELDVQEPATEVEVQEPVIETEIIEEAEQDNETVEPSNEEPSEVVTDDHINMMAKIMAAQTRLVKDRIRFHEEVAETYKEILDIINMIADIG